MSETTTEAVQDNVQEVATDSQNQEPTNPEVGNLIAESKKYRNRAQEIESKYADLKAQIEKDKEEKMIKNNEHKELANKYKTELDTLMPDYERLKNMENTRREKLLDSLDEDLKDQLQNADISLIETVSNKFKTEKQEVASTSSTPARATNPTNKNWVDMTSEERRANWGEILQSYVKR